MRIHFSPLAGVKIFSDRKNLNVRKKREEETNIEKRTKSMFV